MHPKSYSPFTLPGIYSLFCFNTIFPECFKTVRGNLEELDDGSTSPQKPASHVSYQSYTRLQPLDL